MQSTHRYFENQGLTPFKISSGPSKSNAWMYKEFESRCVMQHCHTLLSKFAVFKTNERNNFFNPGKLRVINYFECVNISRVKLAGSRNEGCLNEDGKTCARKKEGKEEKKENIFKMKEMNN